MRRKEVDTYTFGDISLDDILYRHKLIINGKYTTNVRHKMVFLINLFITLLINKDRGTRIPLRSPLLHRVVGKNYKALVDTLEEIGLIRIHTYRVHGTLCKDVELIDRNIVVNKINNIIARKYMIKWDREMRKLSFRQKKR